MFRLKRHLKDAVFAIVVLGAVCMVILNVPARSLGEDKLDQNGTVADGKTADKSKSVVHLYFTDKKNSFLSAEQRTLLNTGEAAEFGKTIIEALIQGPREGLMRTIPPETTLHSLYVAQDGTAYVDITATIKDAHPGGVRSEQMTIFSIVNSLILNIPEIDAVKILIDGSEAMTLAGHIDLRFPFRANMLLIR
jgi:spore germination protein GerM